MLLLKPPFIVLRNYKLHPIHLRLLAPQSTNHTSETRVSREPHSSLPMQSRPALYCVACIVHIQALERFRRPSSNCTMSLRLLCLHLDAAPAAPTTTVVVVVIIIIVIVVVVTIVILKSFIIIIINTKIERRYCVQTHTCMHACLLQYYYIQANIYTNRYKHVRTCIQKLLTHKHIAHTYVKYILTNKCA